MGPKEMQNRKLLVLYNDLLPLSECQQAAFLQIYSIIQLDFGCKNE